MINVQDKSNCSGCHACFSKCPLKCIEMVSDEEGFKYPKVDTSKCIQCGLCDSVCVNNVSVEHTNMYEVYACFNKCYDTRIASSSGGVFSLFAEWIIANGGFVYGAAFDTDLLVHHICIDSKSDIGKIRGSKYVQSSMGSVFGDIKNKLEEGRLVLFTGTPCQVDGLVLFLGKKYNNLYTQDIICHGVPSPKIWRYYLMYLEKKYGKIKERNSIFFRDKSVSWENFQMKILFENGYIYSVPHRDDIFMKAFLNNLSLRPSCYNCKSKSIYRSSDITLADFWGIKEISPDMYNPDGTSLVLVNTKKGSELLNNISDRIEKEIITSEDVFSHNSPAYKSVDLPLSRRKFFSSISPDNIESLTLKLLKKSIIKKFAKKFLNH